VVLEALAAAVPVVATAVGGTPEVIEDGKTGFLVSPGDAAALARRVGDLLDDARLRRALGAAGRCCVAERFSFTAQAEQYQELFARLTRRPTGFSAACGLAGSALSRKRQQKNTYEHR